MNLLEVVHGGGPVGRRCGAFLVGSDLGEIGCRLVTFPFQIIFGRRSFFCYSRRVRLISARCHIIGEEPAGAELRQTQGDKKKKDNQTVHESGLWGVIW